MAGKAVVAHQASHFFNQIHFALQVHGARGGHLHLPAVVVGAKAAAQGAEDLFDLGVGQVGLLAVGIDHRAEQVVQRVAAQAQRRARCFLALMAPALLELGAAEFLQQLRGSIGGRECHLPRQTLLKTAAGIGAQAHAAGAAAHGLGGKHRRLKPDAGGGVIHAAVVATDHAGQSDGLVGVTHHPGFLAEAVLTGIESLEGLGGAAAAQIKPCRIGLAATEGRQFCGIKGMQRLAELEHHQIGDVDHVVDRTQAGPLQPALQPLG